MPHQRIKGMIHMSDPRVTLIGHPAPAWLVNYADLMTELVCFFIILYALSASLNKDVQKAKKEVEEAMKQEQVAGEVKVTKDGMQITLQENGENVFFESGSADLSNRMDEIMVKIAPTLKKLADDGHDIVVEGHTDNIPIHNAKFSSNWELSTARATNVVQHLIRQNRLPAKHMGAIGYGEFKPLVTDNSEASRAKNRRVVFFVKNKPPEFDKGKKEKSGEKVEATTPSEPAPDATSQGTEPTSAEAPGGEPSAENAIQAPAEVPAEQTAQ